MDAIFRQAGTSPQMLKVILAVHHPAIVLADVVVVLIDGAAIVVSAAALPVRAHDLAVFGLLLACNGATVELTRRVGENLGLVKDVHAIWELPVAILLPPFYALLMPIVRLALTQWRVRRGSVYRRVFSAAAIGLSYVTAALVFRGPHSSLRSVPARLRCRPRAGLDRRRGGLRDRAVGREPGPDPDRDQGLGPRASGREEQLFGSESLRNDLTEMCMAVLSTLAIAMSLLTVVIALPLATLLQRSLRHAQLVQDSRVDAKTGLLNAATWERDATAEVTRAVRTRTALAVAMLDIDRFKAINDTYGHLLGDQVIKEIAHTLTALLRDYDQAGRFGGEEFALLLPQTRAVDAFRIAERVRSAISGLCIIAPGATGGERVHVTVSIGVAALDSGGKREYAELMAAADAALYRAKASGRDQVQMISTTRGLSAVSSAPRAVNGAITEDHGPSLFRRAVSS